MPRAPRIEFKGALVHAFLKGNNATPLFQDEWDRLRFLAEVDRAKRDHDFKLLAYTLLPGEIHLVLETGETPLRIIMHQINRGYAKYYNHRYKRAGQVFEGRYKNRHIQKDKFLLPLVRHLHQAPVEAGLAGSPEAYRWSSYNAFMGGKAEADLDLPVILDLFAGEDSARAGLYFRAFHEGRETVKVKRKLRHVRNGVLGDRNFRYKIRENIN